MEGIKDSKDKLNYELDWEFLEGMAERMQVNKDKYPPYNWKNPMDLEKLRQALFRHCLEIMKGNFSDEQVCGHLFAIACNAMMINHQLTVKI